MVRYSDPEDEDTSRIRKRRSTGERMRAARERNAALTGEAAVDGAREAALKLLDRRAYASGKLAAKLTEKGFSHEAVRTVIERFTEVGLLDDLSFAHALVHDRRQMRGLVGRALVMELRKQGLDEDVIARVMAEQEFDQDAAYECGLALARRKYLSAPPQRAAARTSSFLARRGYSTAVISRIIGQLQHEVAQATELY